MVGFCEFISACFLLWAILKLHVVSGRNLTLRELLNQKFITVHIVTLLIYLTSIAIYYTYFGLWSDDDPKSQNRVFVLWGVSQILLCICQLVLIYLFWRLSRKQSSTESDETEEDIRAIFSEAENENLRRSRSTRLNKELLQQKIERGTSEHVVKTDDQIPRSQSSAEQ